ncbi:hypothetical protein [Geomonas sp.]|uniref:hypothetical protein n=1 Tax=Geomonas sp. TaxID=2651584 RepID=UPI002B4A1D42|nr:hypothetical protein [Geomonas sp.]
MLLAVESSAEDSKRYVCTGTKGERRFTETSISGCQEIPLEQGWRNFLVAPSAIVDIKPGVLSEGDGVTLWMRFYLAEEADDAKGRWAYDYLESLHKFYCGKRETVLIKGTYKLKGETVFVRSAGDSIIEKVDAGTVNEAIYLAVCEDDK